MVKPSKRTVWFASTALLSAILVLALSGVLLAGCGAFYRRQVVQAREAVLREDLYRMRDLIDQYWADKGKYPASLKALVEDGYLREIPRDPITRSNEWKEVAAEEDNDNPGAQAGISDVHSTSGATSLEGTPYNEW